MFQEGYIHILQLQVAEIFITSRLSTDAIYLDNRAGNHFDVILTP